MTDVTAVLDGSILRVTLDRPDHGNAASDEMVAELTRLVSGAAERADLVLLRGAGADFCRGRARMGVRAAVEPEALERRNSTEVVFDFYRAVRNAKVPVIAAVQGAATGFGCAVAAICDITIAAASARFSTPEMEHGVLPTVVMSTFVDRVPRKALAFLIYSSAEIGAERALSFGIVSDIVPDAELDAAADKLCAMILKSPPIAIRGAKEYLRSAPDMAIEGAVDYARNLHALINSSQQMRRPRH